MHTCMSMGIKADITVQMVKFCIEQLAIGDEVSQNLLYTVPSQCSPSMGGYCNSNGTDQSWCAITGDKICWNVWGYNLLQANPEGDFQSGPVFDNIPVQCSRFMSSQQELTQERSSSSNTPTPKGIEGSLDQTTFHVWAKAVLCH